MFNVSAGEALLKEMGPMLERGVLPLSIYGDPEIFALEQDRIFGRNWIFLAHDSEIPNPGDFVLRNAGGGRWIVVRDDGGTIRVLFDSCRHRGTAICRADKGNAKVFRCPYHAWTYGNDGTLIGVPSRQEAYGTFDTAEWSLLQAPQIAIRHGLVWINLDPDAQSFEDHLGAFSWYFDVHFGAASGMEVIGEPHRWIAGANWKSGAENFSGDSYHTQFLHRSIAELGLFDLFASPANDVHVTECDGHATSIRRTDTADSLWGYPPEVLADYRAGSLSPEQKELARRSVVTTGTVFPNLSLIHVGLKLGPTKPAVAYLSLRQWQPRGSNEVEIWSWIFVPKITSPEYKELAYRTAVASFSPSGNFEQDDTVVWTSIPRSAGSVFARQSKAVLNYTMGMPPADRRTASDWAGPGTVYASRLEEGVQLTFFRHWLAEMVRP